MADRIKASIGVLGGSFDPVHNGHCAIAQAACEHFHLEKVIFIPAGTPPHKATVCASSIHRLAMLRRAIAGNPMFDVWDIELRREGKSYTVDTIAALKRRYPGRRLFFIIGSDNLTEIPAWHRYKQILRMCTLCVAGRPGYPLRVPAKLRSARILAFPSARLALSSSEIRGLLKMGLSCRYCIAHTVYQYIKKHALYL